MRSAGMMVTIDTVLEEVQITRQELVAWVEQEWVLPAEEHGSYMFNEADRARVKLIVELRRDMAINDEAMPVVLQLLDQVYALRRTLNGLHDAIAALPEDVRAKIDAHLPHGDN